MKKKPSQSILDKAPGIKTPDYKKKYEKARSIILELVINKDIMDNAPDTSIWEGDEYTEKCHKNQRAAYKKAIEFLRKTKQ